MATVCLRCFDAWRMFALFASLCLIFGSVPGAAQYTGAVTIGQYSAFSSLRPCAQSCFVGNGDGDGILSDNTPDIEDELGCGFGALNDCLCRSDLMVTATSFLSSCVSKECNNSNDVTSAVTVYSNYCVMAANGPAASTTSSSSSSIPSSTSTSASPSSTASSPSVATSTASSIPTTMLTSVSSSQSSTSAAQTSAVVQGTTNLSTGAKAGIGVGASVGGIFIIGVGFFFFPACFRRRRNQPPPPGSSAGKLGAVHDNGPPPAQGGATEDKEAINEVQEKPLVSPVDPPELAGKPKLPPQLHGEHSVEMDAQRAAELEERKVHEMPVEV